MAELPLSVQDGECCCKLDISIDTGAVMGTKVDSMPLTTNDYIC